MMVSPPFSKLEVHTGLTCFTDDLADKVSGADFEQVVKAAKSEVETKTHELEKVGVRLNLSKEHMLLKLANGLPLGGSIRTKASSLARPSRMPANSVGDRYLVSVSSCEGQEDCGHASSLVADGTMLGVLLSSLFEKDRCSMLGAGSSIVRA